MSLASRLQHAWNSFMNRDPTHLGYGTSYRPDRIRLTGGNEKTIVTSIYNRIALDVAAINIEQVQLDENDKFLEILDTGLNQCLRLKANLDQTARSFIQDVAISLFDEGCVALVPVDADVNPYTGKFDVLSLRTGKILEWYPKHVKVRVYDENTAMKKDIVLSKNLVGIVENPFYAVMNEPNSIGRRLQRKLQLLDVIDEQSGSGKMNMIIQLPYLTKTLARKQQAEERRAAVEDQLYNSKYGIAYIDGSEHVTQLNRPLDNNLMSQVEYLTEMLYSELGITKSIMEGTADEKTMLNYYNRTIEPVVSAIVDEMKIKFLSETARNQKQSILFFRDPFKLVPISDLAELTDKLTRNEVASPNEMRQAIGMKPVSDPKADELRNRNLNEGNNEDSASTEEYEEYEDY